MRIGYLLGFFFCMGIQASSAERAIRWFRRNPSLGVSSALATLALVAATGMAIAYAFERESAARRLKQVNEALVEEGNRTQIALRENYRQLAAVALERGETQRRAGNTSRGLLQLVEAVRYASDAGDAGLERSARASIAVWRGQIHRLRSVIPGPERLEGKRFGVVAFGPSGQTALVGSNKTASLIDLVSGKVLGPEFAFPGLAYAVAMSPDGKTAAVAEFGSPNPEDSASWRSTVRLWEGRTGRAVTDPIRHPAAVTLEGVPGLIQAIAFSPDGKTLLTV